MTLNIHRYSGRVRRPDFLHLLASRKIPIYDVADFEDDLAILKSIGRL
ncbi:MAG: hypothetical protein AAFV90_11460 [Cyanobacteria bacterium J06634_5]